MNTLEKFYKVFYGIYQDWDLMAEKFFKVYSKSMKLSQDEFYDSFDMWEDAIGICWREDWGDRYYDYAVSVPLNIFCDENLWEQWIERRKK